MRLDAEQGVLGALMTDSRSWDRLDGKLKTEDFYRKDHRIIYRALERLFSQGVSVDQITVFDDLRASGEAAEAGGIEYLSELAINVPSSANIVRYAEIVLESRVRRELTDIGRQIAQLGESDGKPDELIEQATALAMSIADERSAGNEPKSIGEILPSLLDLLSTRADAKGGVTGLSTGFNDLDAQTCGLHPGDLVIVAGRPSMGKTTFAVNIAENVAVNGKVALVISLEMDAKSLAERCVARFGEINTQTLRSGNFRSDDWPRLTASLGRLEAQKLIIADDSSLANVSKIRLAARKVKQKQGALDLIVIDYLQLMGGDGFNRNDELSGITRALKLMAKELGCPIVALSQLSRKVEERTDKRPMMSDLRESGAIEQDADVIIMAYRDDYYNENSAFKEHAEMIIRKQRMGPLGTVYMKFEGKYSRFLDADNFEIQRMLNSFDSTKDKKSYSRLRD